MIALMLDFERFLNIICLYIFLIEEINGRKFK